MNKIILALSLVLSMLACNKSDVLSSKEMVLWYDEPGGESWSDGLLIGNGYMGGNVFGRVDKERIALNESSFWSGRPHDYNDPDAHSYYDQIKELVYAGEFKEAERLIDAHFYGQPVAQQAFMPIGDLLLDFGAGGPVSDYYRELDMETGVVTITYTQGGVKMKREVFMSYPDHVMVMKVSADKPGMVNVEAKLDSPFRRNLSVAGNLLTMNGTWTYLPDKDYFLIPRVDGDGMSFETDVVVLPHKGKLAASDSSLVVKEADSVTFILTIATDFVNYKDISGDPSARCQAILSAVEGKSYKKLKAAHVNDFSGLMSRVHLNVGEPYRNATPTDERIAASKQGVRDEDLMAKFFQFGRYMTVSSSREGGQPANLQGIWNESLLPSWGSKYTININTEMNYWSAEVANLPECTSPLFHMLEDLAENGVKTAKTYYDADGWVVHHNTDLWRGTAPVDGACWGMWPTAGAWLCRHLWEHYLYTEDKDFLKKYYPIMKGSAEFLLDILEVNPNYNYLTVPFSMLPEQGFYVEGKPGEQFIAPSTTMDNAIIRDLFPNVMEAASILGVDSDFSEQLASALERIPPYMIGADGTLQSWIEDWKRGGGGHCWSGNYGLFPGYSITLRDTPELAGSIRKWLESRISYMTDGWPGIVDLCLWARLEDGAMTDEILTKILTRACKCGKNLYNASYNQADFNYGITAAVAECLLQSHAGEITILPALPVGWKDGSVSGLKARGGYEVSITWKDGALVSCTIKSELGHPFTVRYGEKTAAFDIEAGHSITFDANLE